MQILVNNLQKHGTGFLVDELTMNFYLAFRFINPDEKTSKNNPLPTFKQLKFLSKTVRAKKSLAEENLAYGILVRNHSMFNYLKRYVLNNWFQMEICRKNLINSELQNSGTLETTDPPSVFSKDGGLFLPTLYGCLVLLCIALLAGFAYEFWKRKIGNDIRPAREVKEKDGSHGASTDPI